MKLEELYFKLPIPLQQLAVNFEGWRIVRKNFGGKFHNFFKEAESRTFCSQEQIQTFRDQRLQAFLRHCYQTVPYYRRLFKKYRIVPEDIKTLRDLDCVPILSKQDVQDHLSELISEAVPKKELILIKTSGTTGGAIHFYTTKQAIQEQWAIWWRYRRWHGIEFATWCGQFTGNRIVSLSQKRSPFWRYDYPGKRIHFSPLHMTPDNLLEYIAEIKRHRLLWLHGYPSLIALLASYILEKNIDLGYKILWITIGGENLLPHQITLIRKAFGTYPLQHYGMAEAVANFSECEFGKLHVDEDFSAVEFLPIQNKLGYKVIGTSFSNMATPFLRYDVQDIVNIENQFSCQCGRPGRIITNIDGRQDDYIILLNGVIIGGIDHFFKDIINIREVQLIQKLPGELLVKIVRGDLFSEKDELAVYKEIDKRLGKDIIVQIEYTDYIPRCNNKFRFIISYLSKGKLNNI